MDQTLGGFLDWIAGEYGPRPALLYKPSLKTQVWTYRELRQTADRVARWLQEQGVGKGDRVVLWATNSPHWVACFFGVLRNGSVLVPLDARSSPDFVERVVSQSEPKIAICASRMAKSWSYDVPVFELEELSSVLPVETAANLPEVEPDDLAEIIFTSGTTGSPKGVMLSHRNIRSNVEGIYEVFPCGPDFRPLSILPLSHLLEQTCGLLLALRGGTAIAYATAIQPAAIQRDMAEYRVTTMVLVPRILSLFMSSIEQGVRKAGKERAWRSASNIARFLPLRARRLLFRDVIRRFGGRLNFLVTGGAPREPELERKWELMGIAILQGYGATEASPIITGTALNDRRPKSVGKALPGTELKLSDEGEILVKGPNIMQGYWRNPEATAEVLHDGWYSTGDLGELDGDGRLYLKGRKKNMIVLANGMNVFPEDLEDVLGRVPGVLESVIMTVPSEYGPQIHAVLLCSRKDIDLDTVVQQANAQLAPHQHIRSYQLWRDPDFPRTHTMKIKRAEVAKVILAEQRGEKAAAPKATLQAAKKPGVERVLATVLGKPMETIETSSKLSDIGLTGENRIRLGRAIEDELGKFLDDSRITSQTTVGELEALLTSENLAGEHLYPLWPFSRRVRWIRSILHSPLFFAERVLVAPTVVGRSNVDKLGPAIFVTEYANLLDAPFILGAMPRSLASRVGISTSWKTSKVNRWVASLVAFFFNSFRYSPAGSSHASLVHASGLLDHDWSILFMLRPDYAGQKAEIAQIALLAAEFDVPVVPVRAFGLNRTPPVWLVPRRRTVTIVFGAPIQPKQGATPPKFEHAIQRGLLGLKEFGRRDREEAEKEVDSKADERPAEALSSSSNQGNLE